MFFYTTHRSHLYWSCVSLSTCSAKEHPKGICLLCVQQCPCLQASHLDIDDLQDPVQPKPFSNSLNCVTNMKAFILEAVVSQFLSGLFSQIKTYLWVLYLKVQKISSYRKHEHRKSKDIATNQPNISLYIFLLQLDPITLNPTNLFSISFKALGISCILPRLQYSAPILEAGRQRFHLPRGEFALSLLQSQNWSCNTTCSR